MAMLTRLLIFSESRYLLILTENYAALPILQQKLLEMQDTVIIFGSSFPKDQEYTQVRQQRQDHYLCVKSIFHGFLSKVTQGHI